MEFDSDDVIIPSHLQETLRYQTYKWDKKSVLRKLAREVVERNRERHSFLGYSLDSTVAGPSDF